MTIAFALPFTLSTSGPGLWYATRATGLVAFVMLSYCVVLGVVTTVRFESRRWPRFLTVGLHRNVSLVTVAFLALHVVTTVADTYTSIGLVDVFVPFVSGYRPFWLGVGTVACDLLLALVLSSLVRTRLGFRGWRLIHWTAYAGWPLALVHALGTGTDPTAGWMEAVTLCCLVAVLSALGWRLAYGWPRRRGLRTAIALGAVVTLFAGLAWAHGGPFAPGWSKKAEPLDRTAVRLRQTATARVEGVR